MSYYYQPISSESARKAREEYESISKQSIVFGGMLLKDKGFKCDTIALDVDVMEVTRQMCEGSR